MKTDYTETLTRTRDEKETVYTYNLINRRRQPVLSTTFRCVPGEDETRVIEECGEERFIHAIGPGRKADRVVIDTAREYSVECFLGLLERMRWTEDAE
jgi:hypothetical protein